MCQSFRNWCLFDKKKWRSLMLKREYRHFFRVCLFIYWRNINFPSNFLVNQSSKSHSAVFSHPPPLVFLFCSFKCKQSALHGVLINMFLFAYRSALINSRQEKMNQVIWEPIHVHLHTSSEIETKQKETARFGEMQLSRSIRARFAN